MNALRRLASETLDREMTRLRENMAALAASLLLIVLAGLLGLAGMGFALVGIYSSLSAVLPQWQAGVLLALMLLLAATALVVCSRNALHARRTRRSDDDRAPGATGRAHGATASPSASDLEDSFRAGMDAASGPARGVDSTDAAVGAFAAGLLAGRRVRRKR